MIFLVIVGMFTFFALIAIIGHVGQKAKPHIDNAIDEARRKSKDYVDRKKATNTVEYQNALLALLQQGYTKKQAEDMLNVAMKIGQENAYVDKRCRELIEGYYRNYLNYNGYFQPNAPDEDLAKNSGLRVALQQQGISEENFISTGTGLNKLRVIISHGHKYAYGRDTESLYNEVEYNNHYELRDALDYFGINKEDWKQSGSFVITKYSLWNIIGLEKDQFDRISKQG